MQQRHGKVKQLFQNLETGISRLFDTHTTVLLLLCAWLYSPLLLKDLLLKQQPFHNRGGSSTFRTRGHAPAHFTTHHTVVAVYLAPPWSLQGTLTTIPKRGDTHQPDAQHENVLCAWPPWLLQDILPKQQLFEHERTRANILKYLPDEAMAQVGASVAKGSWSGGSACMMPRACGSTINLNSLYLTIK